MKINWPPQLSGISARMSDEAPGRHVLHRKRIRVAWKHLSRKFAKVHHFLLFDMKHPSAERFYYNTIVEVNHSPSPQLCLLLNKLSESDHWKRFMSLTGTDGSLYLFENEQWRPAAGPDFVVPVRSPHACCSCNFLEQVDEAATRSAPGTNSADFFVTLQKSVTLPDRACFLLLGEKRQAPCKRQSGEVLLLVDEEELELSAAKGGKKKLVGGSPHWNFYWAINKD